MTRLEEMAKAAWERENSGWKWANITRLGRVNGIADMRAAIERLIEIETAQMIAPTVVAAMRIDYLREILAEHDRENPR